jgi:hypothetical protein
VKIIDWDECALVGTAIPSRLLNTMNTNKIKYPTDCRIATTAFHEKALESAFRMVLRKNKKNVITNSYVEKNKKIKI